MKLLAGLVLIGGGVLWLLWMYRRKHRPTSPAQALIDFITGAPRDSVVGIGLVLFGLLVVLAHFVGD